MGISPSKRVRSTFQNSSGFAATCTTAFTTTVSSTPHTFPGILPYQLLNTSLSLHQSLSSTCPLIKRWAPSPPSQLQVDTAYKSLRRDPPREYLDSDAFREFAVELFTDAVVGNARMAVLKGLPVGVVGIAGVGLAGKVAREVVAAGIGVYALGVATSVYISLG